MHLDRSAPAGRIVAVTTSVSGSRALAEPFLGQQVRVIVDRPLGSRHPRAGFVYELNYGFVPDVPAPDGDDLDAYLIGTEVPLVEGTGRCVAVVHRLEDDDDKLIIALDDRDRTDTELLELVAFQEATHHHELLRA